MNGTGEVQIDVGAVLAFYKQEVAELTHDRIVMKARIKALEDELAKLREST